MLVIKPYGNLLLLNKLRYQEDIRDSKSLSLPKDDLIKEKELDMAKKLSKQLSAKFKPQDYQDNYITELRKLIEAKVRGKKFKKPKQASEIEKVTDIMTLLKKSLRA